MPTAKVQELVAATKLWYETHKHDTRQRDLAEKLGVSATGLCNIFAGVNQPSATTALAMIRFLEEKNMKTTYLDPRATPRQAASNPSVPLTLSQAKEMLAARDAEIAALRRGAATSPKPAFTAPPPTAQPKLAGSGADSPTYPTTGSLPTPGADRLAPTPMPVNMPATPKKPFRQKRTPRF